MDDNVYYINVKPYFFSLPYEIMAERYYDTFMKKTQVDKKDFVYSIVTNMKRYNYVVRHKSELEQTTDKVVSKQLLIHLENFFKKGRSKNTRKHKSSIKSKTTRKKNMFI